MFLQNKTNDHSKKLIFFFIFWTLIIDVTAAFMSIIFFLFFIVSSCQLKCSRRRIKLEEPRGLTVPQEEGGGGDTKQLLSHVWPLTCELIMWHERVSYRIILCFLLFPLVSCLIFFILVISFSSFSFLLSFIPITLIVGAHHFSYSLLFYFYFILFIQCIFGVFIFICLSFKSMKIYFSVI